MSHAIEIKLKLHFCNLYALLYRFFEHDYDKVNLFCKLLFFVKFFFLIRIHILRYMQPSLDTFLNGVDSSIRSFFLHSIIGI
jgi:hypothetical protein